MEGLPGGRPDAFVLDHLLGEHLVHRDRGAEIARSGIRDAEHVKCRLHAAVLAVHAVQRHVYDVRHTADLQNAFSEQRRALPLSGLFHRFEVRCCPVKGQRFEFRQLLKQGGGIVRHVLQSHEKVHQNCLMAS